jgi:signal peptidase I
MSEIEKIDENLSIKEPESKIKKFFIDLADIIAFLIFIAWLFFFIKIFILSIVIVKWHSMLPNYNEWNVIFVDKFYWKLDWWIKRGDVVVVMPPTTNVSYLKRVIGLPSETIEITGGNVYLCKKEKSWKNYTWNDVIDTSFYKDKNLICKQLKEEYISWKTVNLKWFPEKIITEAKCGINKFKLGTWQYLVFGDDRMYSTDSRCCFKWVCIWKHDTYYITKDEIIGRVWNSYFNSKK